MKVVINTCFGGFSLSPRAVKRLAELNGRECYFFTTAYGTDGSLDIYKHQPISLEELEGKVSLFFSAYDIPNPDDLLPSSKRWHTMTDEDKRLHNEFWESHSLDTRPENRSDPKLIQVIEELGSGHRTGASGAYADLCIIEIPDGVEYEIEEYDGNEHIAEKHRTWHKE